VAAVLLLLLLMRAVLQLLPLMLLLLLLLLLLWLLRSLLVILPCQTCVAPVQLLRLWMRCTDSVVLAYSTRIYITSFCANLQEFTRAAEFPQGL
jgi:hypothetical protein